MPQLDSVGARQLPAPSQQPTQLVGPHGGPVPSAPQPMTMNSARQATPTRTNVRRDQLLRLFITALLAHPGI